MKLQRPTRLNTAILAGLLVSGHGALSASTALAADAPTVEKKTRILASQPYPFVKTIDARGETRAEIIDGSGKSVGEKDVPRGVAPLVDPRLLDALTKLERSKSDQALRVEIALNLPADVSEEVLETGAGEVEKGRWIKGLLNGKEISEKDMAAYADRYAQEEQAARAKRTAVRMHDVQDWAARHGLSGQNGLEEALRQGRSGATLDLTAKQLRSLIDSRDTALAGIELHEPGKDTIDDAMDATGISASALPNATTRGNGIGIYMTESGCANESRITNYDRLSGSETDHSRNVGAILRSVSPESFIYCRGGAVLPEDSDLDGVGGNSPIHVVNRSNGGNNSTGYNTTDRDWDNFIYDDKIATFVSAGNNGAGAGNTISPAKGLNVITVQHRPCPACRTMG